MKLLTLNTHSLIEPAYEAKRDAFVEFIRKEQPDVFALQEVNQTAAAPLLADVPAGYYPCPGNMVLLKADNHAAAVARMLEEAGCAYHWSWLPAKIGYDRYDEGMAVFSRAPITAAENLLLSQINDYNNWKTRRALGICAGDVWYYTVHLGWWKDEVEPFASRTNDALITYYCNTIRIGLAVKRGNMAEVKSVLDTEKGIDTANIAFTMRQVRNNYLRRYYESTGNYRMAYDNLREDMRKNDSLEHNRINMRASEIMERFTQDTLKLHHSLELERKNADIQQAHATTFAVVSAALVLALIFAL